MSQRVHLGFASVFLLGASVGSFAFAAEDAGKHLLRYKFATGDVLRWEVDVRSSVRSTIEGTTQETETKTVSTKAWKVIDVLPSGEIEFINLVERVRMANDLPDRAPVKFDSASGETPPGFEDVARAVGTPLSAITINPRGEITKREVKHHQPAADPHEQIVLLLPEGPIGIGETWSQPQEIRVNIQDGGTRSIEARRKHRLKEVENGVAVIESEFQVLTPTTPEIDGQLAHRHVKGLIRFDIQRGRVVSQRLDGDERVLGFAGPSSSMHFLSRLEEKLLAAPASVANRP
ncbi:hypothetical protein [Botrimarina hoheduenensis]|uniref:Preprotein translocase subunit SecD n=1 Tax=Botrimarina hoheduenensis TaxID=2528000 RepID=A0A5C5VSK0_9BACT|nr:hypothetical protein [Botrimarina hoheduenensis]TWT41598.1 hypothetical protein Pla111_29750 [Botrimarina hoheduenensis]